MRPKPKEYRCYSDESCNNDRFMVFGGIVTPACDVDKFNAHMAQWRVQNNMHHELKWTKVSNGNYAEYRSLVDLFFKHNVREGLPFKAVVFDMSQVDYKTYHHGDKELSFYKFYYQFFLHRFG